MSQKRRRDEVPMNDGVAVSAPNLPDPASCAAPPEDPVLSHEQQSVLRAVRNRENIFLTGSAGVGKSVTLRAIIRTLREMYGEKRVSVCASTGIAAEPLGGSTLHSFAACGKGEYYRNFLTLLNKDHRERIVDCAALVIDEISMVSGEFIDAICDVTSLVRGACTHLLRFPLLVSFVAGCLFRALRNSCAATRTSAR